MEAGRHRLGASSAPGHDRVAGRRFVSGGVVDTSAYCVPRGDCSRASVRDGVRAGRRRTVS